MNNERTYAFILCNYDDAYVVYDPERAGAADGAQGELNKHYLEVHPESLEAEAARAVEKAKKGDAR